MNKLSIHSVPAPFNEIFAKQEQAGNSSNSEKAGNSNDMQDLLFLAAILMLCDE